MDSRTFHIRVFLPSYCLKRNHGILIGERRTSVSWTTYMVSNIVMDIDDLEGLAMKLQNVSEIGREFEILGFWQSRERKEMQEIEESNYQMLQTKYASWILMETVDGALPRCDARGSRAKDSEDLLVILYDHCEVINSVFITGQKNSVLDSNGKADNQTTLEVLVFHTETFEQLMEKNKDLKMCYHNDQSAVQKYLFSLEQVFIKIFSVTWTALLFCKKIVPYTGLVHILKVVPASTQQLRTRGNQIQNALDNTSSYTASALSKQRGRDQLYLHALDVLFGIFAMYWLLQGSRPGIIGNIILSWAEHVVTYLQYLLRWMNGAPAGLKLNRQLNELLGKFFMYHIYLWTGYLDIVRPLLVVLVHIVAVTGILGISTQLAITHDLITMLTLHIYCFYVYAAKLYSLQIYTLTSLWRLFRGKKWNVIRQRVDSASFDVDQLFIGTLLFTALLFLLPTVGLYYIVFTALRLVVIGMQVVLQKLIELINLIPVASLVCWIFSPKYMSDRCKFTAIPRKSDRSQYLMMQMQPASVSKVMTLLCNDKKADHPGASSLLGKLCTGEILYPWIEPRPPQIRT